MGIGPRWSQSLRQCGRSLLQDVVDGRSYTWLKWVAAAVLFVEAYVGVALPFFLRITPSAQWYLSLANAFAGGAFFTFGALQSQPRRLVDSLRAQMRQHAVSILHGMNKSCVR